MKKILSALLMPIMLSTFPAIPTYAANNEVKIYVSTEGSDSMDGKKLTSAVKTIPRAIELERKYKTVGKTTHIIFKGGTYCLDETMKLTDEDSGTEAAPVIFRAYRGDSVRFTMGKKLSPSDFKISDNDEIAESAKGKVYEADLSGFDKLTGGFSDTFYADGGMKHLSQYPNRNASGKASRCTFALNEDKSAYLIPDEKQSSWANKTDILYSFMPNGYSWQAGAVGGITDTEIKLGGESAIIYNLLCEVDDPGEYYIDKTEKKLYYYPEADISGSDMYLATGENNLITMENASNIRLEGIDFICTTGKRKSPTSQELLGGIDMRNCANIVIYNSVMRAMGGCAVYAESTAGLQILKCDISDLKRGAVSISGGDTVKLISSNNVIKNCRIHDFGEIFKSAYGASIHGAGIRFTNNDVYNCSSIAVAVTGNDNIIENNRIHNTMLNVWDSGSIYLGRTWIGRGNIIRNNYIYDSRDLLDYSQWTDGYYWSGTDNQGIYLDDMISGNTVTGNIIYNMSRGMLIGGGSDNTVDNNVVIDCRRGFAYDNRGMSWGYKQLDEQEQYSGYIYKSFKSLLGNADYNENLWKNKYPGFAELLTRAADFEEQAEKITDNGKRISLIRTTIGKPYNIQVNNNIYAGSYANDYASDKYTTYISQTSGYKYDGTAQTIPSDAHTVVTKEAAGIIIDGYEITLLGSKLPDGVPKSTAEMGITDDDYIPSYSETEFDVNAANRFVAIAVIYDGNGVLKDIQRFDDCYLYDGQLVNLTMNIPNEADENWYATVMLWNGINGMKPVLKQKLMFFEKTN